jgi:hypothetical protein
MPISPYSAPIQYEYKPLNLSAFAAPLSEMQQKFDIVTEAVDAADFTLANLPYGTDPERAKELIKIVKSKRDELAKNLGETKNYKQAASKLRELNNLWTKDPELNALQANAKLWAERDKAELARVGKGADAGGITRDQYLQWKDREIRKYKENKGAGFSASAADPVGTYNVITGSTGRLTDLAKDLEELSWKVANASPAQKWDAFREAGIDPELMDKKFVKTIVEEKDANKIAQVTSEYLKTLPRFKDWATEVADYNFDALEQNPENYKAVASDLNTKYLSSLNYQINKLEKDSKKDKKILESAEYKDLLAEKVKAEQAGTTGKYDPTATKNLFTHQHLNDVYDMGALGKVLAYKNVTHDYTFRALPAEDTSGAGGAGGAGATGEGFFIPATEEKWSITALNKQKIDSGKNLYGVVAKINNLVSGNVRGAIMGDPNSKQYKELIKHPDQIRAKQEQLLTTLTQTIQSGGDWQKFQTAANKKGIVMSDNRARTLWGSLTKNGNQGISDFAAHIKSSEEDFATYNQANALATSIKKNVQGTEEYKTFISNLENYTPTEHDLGTLEGAAKTSVTKEQKQLFNPKSYSMEQLKKIGFVPTGTVGSITDWLGATNRKFLSLNDIAKLRGYKNVQDAVDKGYNFAGFDLGAIAQESGKTGSTSIWWGTDNYSGKTVSEILSTKQNAVYQKNNSKNEMSYNFINDKNLDKEMSKYFLGVSDLSSYQPAYSKDWNNVPGFTEDGKLAPGTVLNISENRSPKIKVHGNTLLYEVPIKYDSDGNGSADSETTVVIKPKAGMNIKNDDLLYKLDAASGGNTALEKQTNNMIKAARFDSKFQGNNLSPQLIQSVETTPLNKGGKPIELYSIPYSSNTRLEVVKIQGEAGTNPVIKIAVVDANSGKKLQYVPNIETGKDWYENADSNEAASSAKSYIMQILSTPR